MKYPKDPRNDAVFMNSLPVLSKLGDRATLPRAKERTRAAQSSGNLSLISDASIATCIVRVLNSEQRIATNCWHSQLQQGMNTLAHGLA